MKNYTKVNRESEKRKKGYQKTFKKYGVDPKALQWASKKAAEVRYKNLVKDIDFEGKTVLDIGCGFGDIIGHIKKKTNNFDYLGIDIVPEFISTAKKKYPKHKFIVGDYFNNPLNEEFDIVLTSGTLNANDKKPMETRKKYIKTMFDHTNKILAFNMAGGNPQPDNANAKRVYYADSKQILDYCITVGNAKLVSGYHPKDFIVIIKKN
ncbi:class I SAM-dependent methyltransferase [Patescibacteria group bacterium]